MRTTDPIRWSKNKNKRRWWMPRVGVEEHSLEGRVRGSLVDAMREYLEHSSLEGVQYASHVDTSNSLRHIYVFLMVVLLAWGLSVLVYFGYEYGTRPTLQIQLVPTPPEVPVNFPAIAICSNSVISKKQVAAYSKYLVKVSHNMSYTLPMIQENLVKFGALITLTSSDVEMVNFMQFLFNLNPNFNITDMMYMLSPKCTEMLMNCKWRGRQLPCGHLFATRLTQLGFCCVFNGRYLPEDEYRRPKVLNLAGKNYGLKVGVYQNSNDFAYVRQPSTNGMAVLLFESTDFPLLQGGSVRAYNIGVNASAYFQLTAHAQYITKKVKKIDPFKRGCYIMQTDGPRMPMSSYAWCLTECRRNCTLAICNCQPFWHGPATDPICTPEHLYCLNKHREKFLYFYPGNIDEESLEEELQDSMDCLECLPDCARIMHVAKVFESPYIYPKKLYGNQAAGKMSFVNKTLLRFYYDSLSHFNYRVDVNVAESEIFAALSCQSLFLIGVSIISVAELVYHLTIRWVQNYLRRTREERARRRRDAAERRRGRRAQREQELMSTAQDTLPVYSTSDLLPWH